MERTVIEARDLRKDYRMYRDAREKWMDLLLPGHWGQDFSALRGITFEIRAGEAVGIVGRNGSGKTTLSDLIAGVSRPSGGVLRTEGSAAMIAVNAGLSGGLTGAENIELKGLLLGMDRERIRELAPKVVEFADIGEFMDQPVKTYSSGMRARLAFAISINIDPDILVIDEGLSVGDSTFVDRCLERIRRFREDGKTMVFTSHSTAQLREFCDRLLWLEAGELKMDGGQADVMREYGAFLRWFKALSPEEQREYTARRQREQFSRAGEAQDTGSASAG